MHRALASAIGLPSRSTNARSMLVFCTPADVRRYFMTPPAGLVIVVTVTGPLTRDLVSDYQPRLILATSAFGRDVNDRSRP
jgi:hypothetical protein